MRPSQQVSSPNDLSDPEKRRKLPRELCVSGRREVGKKGGGKGGRSEKRERRGGKKSEEGGK